MLLGWDDGKRRANLAKHGIDFTAAEEFDWDAALVRPDDRLDYGEDRFIALGPIGTRLHVLVFTVRGRVVHVISLRKANARERRFYDGVPEAR
ncbi:MAG TPA: BrnT family toxin [Azospirillaceae bacterium]|nr:BrnT family toxin [Azospirillaceae bacterium]